MRMAKKTSRLDAHNAAVEAELEAVGKDRLLAALHTGEFSPLERLYLLWRFDLCETPDQFFAEVAEVFPIESRKEHLLAMKAEWQGFLDAERILRLQK